jgi:hypothetical protein
MEQDGESERIYWAYYDRLHKCRRWNSLLAQLRRLAWFAWGAWIALSVDTLIRDGTAAWLVWSGAVVLLYTILVDSLLKPDLEEEVTKWLRMVRLKGFDSRGDIEDVLIPYMEAERLVEEGWLSRAGEGLYKPHDCGWDALLGTNARGWRRLT